MLKVQEYLKSGKTLADLETEYAIRLTYHPSEPLVILNYDQCDSPKTDPIVAECRGLVLNSQTYELVAKSFNRFFRIGEVENNWKEFNWNNFSCLEKVDGSLINIFYYNNRWWCTTRGSFAQGKVDNYNDFTWEDLVCKALDISNLQVLDECLAKNCNYICELVSPYNKVVRQYKEPQLYLLSVVTEGGELAAGPVNAYLDSLKSFYLINFKEPVLYTFESLEQIQAYMKTQEENDPTWEGVVIRDSNNMRLKIKSPTYDALHRLKDNGNIFNPKYLVPHVLAGNKDKLTKYLPEITEAYTEVEELLNQEFSLLDLLWENNRKLEIQKDFALAVKDKTKFASILFNARKTGKCIKEIWRESEDLIIKMLF